MKITLHLIIIVLFLLTISSCTDEDKGTNPSDEFVGASFHFEDGQSLFYDSFISLDDNVDTLYSYEYKVDYKGNLDSKEYYEYYPVIEDGPFFTVPAIVSTDDDEYSIYFNEFCRCSTFFDGLEDIWVKYIDFKQESWSQFDLKFDSTLQSGEKLKVTYKSSGNKVKDTTINYKSEERYSTIYKFRQEYQSMIGNEIDFEYWESYEFIVIDSVGIYMNSYRYDKSNQIETQVLTDHK